MPLPRILIFGQVFNWSTGGGITLSNLFKDWDKDKLAVANTGHAFSDVNTDICNSYYLLGNKEHKWIFPFNKLQRKFTSGVFEITKNIDKNGNKKQREAYKTGFRKKIVTQVLFPFLEYWGLFHTISSLKISEEFRNWLNNFKPEVLYVQVSNRVGILFAQELHSYLKIPLVIHNMDDWPSTISQKGLLKRYWHKKIDKDFRTLINQSSLLMTISDDMANEYKKRYKKKSVTFHNTIDIGFWKQYQRNDYELHETPTILYAGRIGPGVETSLELIAKAVQQVKEEFHISIKFILQTQENLPWFNKYNCVKHSPPVPYKDLPKKFSESDFLILPYDFSEESINFIRFSMPTKAPEYMISGTPIIIFAPEMTAIVNHAKKFNWAIVITKKSSSELVKAIIFLIQNKGARETIGVNAKKIAEKDFDSNIVGDRFIRAISSI